MSVQFKDYYRILGVPRDANEKDIKQAFRRLARQYHPDVARDKAAAESRFKEINEAYEVLGNPENRRKYDALGADWRQTAGPEWPHRAGPRRTRGRSPFDRDESFEFHFGGTGFSEFFERFFGRSAWADSTTRGAGFANAEPDSEDPEPPRRGQDLEGQILVTFEEALQGGVRPITVRRTNRQTGSSEEQSFQVRLPPGVSDGQTIRVAGHGYSSPHGGPAGDLFLHVRLAAHPDFRREGCDLYHDIELPAWDAVLGKTVTVPTLEGPATVRVPPGTGNGRQLRLRGRGLPGTGGGERGDLFVVVTVKMPSRLTPRERELWEELARISNR